MDLRNRRIDREAAAQILVGVQAHLPIQVDLIDGGEPAAMADDAAIEKEDGRLRRRQSDWRDVDGWGGGRVGEGFAITIKEH